MSNYNAYKDFQEVSSSSARENEPRSQNSLAFTHSNLQATAPEYFPLNMNQGAVRKKPLRQNQEFPSASHYTPKAGKSTNVSDLKPTAQEFYPTNNGSGNGYQQKRSYRKEKNPNYNNWRSPANGYDTGPESRSSFDRPNNPRYSGSHEGYKKKGFYNNSNQRRYERYNEAYGSSTSANELPSHSKYERNYNENANNNGKYTFERRNGYVTKSYKPKPNENKFSDVSDNHDKFPTSNRNSSNYNDELRHKSKWLSNKYMNKNYCRSTRKADRNDK